MSDQVKQEAVDGLLLEGSSNYLDALYALHRFKRIVTDKAVAVWQRRLPDLVSVVGIGGPVSTIPERYCNPEVVGKECDGNWAWVAARVWFPDPWSGHCYLGLSFDRQEPGNICTSYVTFMCGGSRPAVFAKLSFAFRDHDQKGLYYEDERSRECAFSCKLQNPLAMEVEFEEMIEYVIDVWKRIGGWDRLMK